MLTTLYIVICLTEESQVRPEQIDRTVKVAATPVHRRRRYIAPPEFEISETRNMAVALRFFRNG